MPPIASIWPRKGLPASIIALLGSDGSPSPGRLHPGFRCRAPLGISLAIGHNACGNGIDANAGPFHNAGGECSTFGGRDAEPSDDPYDVDYSNRGRATLNSGHHCVGQQAGTGIWCSLPSDTGLPIGRHLEQLLECPPKLGTKSHFGFPTLQTTLTFRLAPGS